MRNKEIFYDNNDWEQSKNMDLKKTLEGRRRREGHKNIMDVVEKLWK